MNEFIINELNSEKRDIEAAIEFFENCGVDFGNVSVYRTTIQYGTMTYDEMCAELHRLRSLGFDMTMRHYFYSHGLVVSYESKNIPYSLLFTVSDEEYAIKKLGGGKCKIESQSVTEKSVVCSMPE